MTKLMKEGRGVAAPLFLAYSRVSTEEQARSGLGLSAQRATIDAAAQCRMWKVEHFSDEGVSGKVIGPALHEVLQLLAAGQGDGLIVAKMDRLSRSIINAANIIQSAQAQGWSLVVLDMNLDLTTAAGRMIAHNLLSFAQYERELISERTKAALAIRKDQGVRLGPKPKVPAGVIRRIVMDRRAGQSYRQIAEALTAEGVLTPAGRSVPWEHSTVRRIYGYAERQTAHA